MSGNKVSGSVCPDIMAETWTKDSHLTTSVTKLHQALLNLKVTPQIIEESVAQFTDRIKLNGVLPACASCGIQYCLVSEDDLTESGRARPSQSDDINDSFRVKPEAQRFIRLGLDNPLFKTLCLTEEQIKWRDNNPYRQIFCAYDDIRDGVLNAVLHLHPPLIEHDPAGGEPKAIVCRECYEPEYMKKKKHLMELTKPRTKDTESNEQRAMSRCLCITEGYDFGNLLGCPELSILEKTLLSQYVFYGTLIKLVAWKGIRQNALKGHVIAFGHTAVNAINRTATLLFPWLDETEVLMSLRVSFVGPRNVADKTLKRCAWTADSCVLT
jgi:hypothetical protein